MHVPSQRKRVLTSTCAHAGSHEHTDKKGSIRVNPKQILGSDAVVGVAGEKKKKRGYAVCEDCVKGSEFECVCS